MPDEKKLVVPNEWLDKDGYVPPEVKTMANHVLSNYDMTVFTMKLITTKPDKGGAIWRLETSKGTRSLKLLHRPLARSRKALLWTWRISQAFTRLSTSKWGRKTVPLNPLAGVL